MDVMSSHIPEYFVFNISYIWEIRGKRAYFFQILVSNKFILSQRNTLNHETEVEMKLHSQYLLFSFIPLANVTLISNNTKMMIVMIFIYSFTYSFIESMFRSLTDIIIDQDAVVKTRNKILLCVYIIVGEIRSFK